MTQQKHFKQLVRTRMTRTGESYTTARRHVLAAREEREHSLAGDPHFPGAHPETTALRAALAHAGVANPATGAFFTEPMVFGIAGGIGAGVFHFYYAAEDFASFYVAGRHRWHESDAYVHDACLRFGVTPTVLESGGKKKAATQLAGAVEATGCAIAWVDMGLLPYRGVPSGLEGGGYHVVTVYRVNEGEALIGDLTDEPISIALDDLAEARARIKKQKNRVLTVAGPQQDINLRESVLAGIEACHDGLQNQRMKNFTLEAFKTWADRMHGSSGKDSWERVFPPGHRLLQGLRSVYDFIERYHTGGGLMRPLYAAFFAEAAEELNDEAFTPLAEMYADLGRQWSDLADAALPDGVAPFRETKQLLARREEVFLSQGAAATEEVKGIWTELSALEQAMREDFPLTDAESANLRAELKERILDIYDKECAAHAALGAVVG
jgi:hypothetical protein